jgi:hypothetical protein
MGANDHLLATCEELELIKVLVSQSGINATSNSFDLVVKRIMGDDLDFIRAIEKNSKAALASYKLTSAEVAFIQGFVLCKIDFEKQIR